MSTEYELNDTPIEDWIDQGVSFLQANVTLYRNPSIYAQYQPVIEQIRSLEMELAPKKKSKRESSLEEALGDDGVGEETLAEDGLTGELNTRLEELYAEAERLWEQYSQDVEVWTLRRVDEQEVEAIRDGMDIPLPTQPGKPGAKPSKQMQAAYAKKFEAFIKGVKDYSDELNLRCLQIAVLKVVVKGEEKPPPSLEGLRRLKARPGGANHIRELVGGLESLATEGVNIMAPHRSGAGA